MRESFKLRIYVDTIVFVDWENLRHEIKNIQKDSKVKDFHEANFNYNNAYHIMALLHSFFLKEEQLKKIFFYTAKPLEIDKIQTDKDEEYYIKATKFLDDIVKLPYVATRLGISKFRGYDSNGRPIIIQKQVDMLLGLDIAHVVYNRLAERILVFSKDIDLIPALKCARTNGITTIIANLKDGFELNHSLIKHSDLVRSRTCEQILHYMRSALQTEL